MNLKEYAQYYIGCRCLNTWFPEDHPEYNRGWFFMAFRTARDTVNAYGLETENQEYLTGTDSIKLILRKLEDVTDDEWWDIETKTSILPDSIGTGGLKDSFFNMHYRSRYHWTIVNQALSELRKRSVDVDGLIDAGLAVDSKTLPK